MLTGLPQDFRFALRFFRGHPAASAIAVLSSDVLRMVMMQGFRMVGLGAAAGIAGALAVARLAGGLLLGVPPADPAVFGAIALILGIVAGVATLIPARRAARVDRMSALRQE